MYKVIIEKDGEVIRTESNMSVVILTGLQRDTSPQIIENADKEKTPSILGILDMLKYGILKQMFKE